MLFNSPEFILFFGVVFALYWSLRQLRRQNVLLLVASYVFYGAWSWKFLGLIAFSTLVDYWCGQRIAAHESPVVRRRYLWLSIAVNLGVLGFFKYFGFFVGEAVALLEMLGFQAHRPVLEIVLPIGISFYTFQSLSYTIDIYRGKLEPIRNPLDFALFVAFFPQLVAGPIERARELLPQIQRPRTFDRRQAGDGMLLVFYGLFKKVVIADNLAPYVDEVFRAPEVYSGGVLATAVVFFAFQIYCDFSGYSDIARGVAKTLGFELVRNFDRPYLSRNPVEFWQRWHISLSRWFQDYLYFPLAMHYMRSGGWLSKYRAHIYSMTLIGLWHGANWTFVLFGLYWGVAIALYLMLREKIGDLASLVSRALPGAGAVLAVLVMFALACVGWILFRAESLGDALYVFLHLGWVPGRQFLLNPEVPPAAGLWVLVLGLMAAEVVYSLRSEFWERVLALGTVRFALRYAMLAGVVVSYVAALETASRPFIYFQF